MDDIYRNYRIIQLNEEDVRKVSRCVMENPFLWDFMGMTAIAVTYNGYKFCCTGFDGVYRKIVILTPEKVLYARYKIKEKKISESTGDEVIDNLVNEISECFFPVDEPEISWLIDTFFGIHEGEYSEPYEKARSGILEYQNKMTEKYLDIDYIERHKYSNPI